MTLDLYIMRHAPSEGNENGIIQGHSFDPFLSKAGIELLQKHINSGIFSALKADGIFCSNLHRAKQTAESIQRVVGTPLIIEPLLHEIDPGILSGKHKAELMHTHPESMKIWYERGDYDGIQNAETGRQAQARALAFLFKIQKQYYAGNFIVVAHAAFNRCLINTIKNRKRNTPVVVDHLAPTICCNIFQDISLKKITNTFSSTVYSVSCAEDNYLVKQFGHHDADRMKERENLLSFLHKQKAPIPEPLFIHTDQTGTYEVQEFLRGTSPLSLLNTTAQKPCLNALFEVSKKLICCKYIATTIPHLEEQLLPLRNHAICLPESFQKFLGSAELANYLNISSKDRELVDYDCHKGNFILLKDGLAKKIDISPIWAPPSYQASCWISGLMLDGLKIEGHNSFSKYWPMVYGDAQIITGIKIRHLLGFAYFSKLLNKSTEIDSPSREKAKYLMETYANGLKELGC